MFENDYCVCYDSTLKGVYGCEYKDCFRHICNHKRPQEGPDIFTMASLKETDYCPYYKEGE